MIDEICGHIHNWFTDAEDIRVGLFTVEGGAVALPFLKEGQYFRIVKSIFNDGVYQYPAEGLTDEVFYGEIWPMKPPRDFLRVAEAIGEWQEKYGGAVAGPYSSESVNGFYSYTKGTNAAEASGAGWMSVFKGQLDRWRKLF